MFSLSHGQAKRMCLSNGVTEEEFKGFAKRGRKGFAEVLLSTGAKVKSRCGKFRVSGYSHDKSDVTNLKW